MWVRSQDKKDLVYVKFIVVKNKAIFGAFDGSSNGYGLLGEYESEQRAIEVLDEIQHQIGTCQSMDSIVDGTRIKRDNVYEMPEA